MLKTKMNTNIWSSSRMGGAGGALKALAKNLANQVNLNRSEMKRVVARVISECHGKGSVGDYNGHMFYMKPERIDITDQIVQSKEVLDEMLYQKRMRSKRSIDRSASGLRSLTYKMTVGDKQDKSLTGVIIDQNYLRNPQHPTDIVVQMSKGLGQTKSKAQLKRAPSSGSKKRATAAARPSTLTKQKSSGKAKVPVRAGKSKNVAKGPVNPMKSPEIPITKPPQQSQQAQAQPQPSRHLLKPAGSRQPAGEMHVKPSMPMKNQVKAKPEKLSVLKKAKSIKLAASKPHSSHIAEDKAKKRTGRLAAGGILPRAHRSVMLSSKKGDNSLGRATNKNQANAGLTPSNNKTNKTKTYNRRSRVSAKHPQPKTAKSNKRPAPSSNMYRRLRQIRSHERLVKDLEREEAIDDPERLENEATKARVRRGPYKVSARLHELAQPSANRRSIPETAPVHSRPAVLHQDPKSGSRPQRVVVDSSLGSILGRKPNSASGLSPAKRNLTLAFMKKDSPPSPRQPRSLLWR